MCVDTSHAPVAAASSRKRRTRTRVASSGSGQQFSVVPDDWYATKCVTIDRHVAEGRERQMSGHQEFASRRQVTQEIDADAGRLLRVVFEAVLPVGVLEPDLEH